MGVKITTISRKFYNPYHNGDDFNAASNDFNVALTGYADERIRVKTIVDVETVTTNNAANPVTLVENVSVAGEWTLTLVSGSWRDEGYAVGNSIFLDSFVKLLIPDVPVNNLATGDIIVVDEEKMVFNITSGSLTAILDAYNVNGLYYQLVIHDLTELTALKYSFGLNSNNEEYNNISKLTGADQTRNTRDLGLGFPRGTLAQGAVPDNADTNNDWNIGGDNFVRYVSTTPDNFVQRFEIVHTFRINPSYIEGQLENLLTKVPPALYFGDASLKYSVKYDFRRFLNNPNTSKIDVDDNNLGCVGWREENLNGFKNDFRVQSVVYTDNGTGLPADGILRSGTTKAVITVFKTSGNWASADRVAVVVKTLVSEENYTNTPSNLDANFLLNDIYHTHTAAISVNPVGSILVSLDTFSPVANLLEYTVLISYDEGEQSKIDEDTYYELTAVAGSGTTDNQNSDRVALIADVAKYDLTNDIAGLVIPVSQAFYEEPLPVSTGLGYTSMSGWNYDNIAAVNVFDIDLNLGAFINSINMVWIAFDPLTQDYWEIQNYAIQYSETQVGAVQQLSLDSSRGFHLEDNSDFNNVIVTTDALVGSLQRYTVQVPFNVDWRDWQPELNADTIFYDNTKPNNNLNKKSSNYSNLNGYELRFGLLFDMSGTSTLTGDTGQTDYLVLSPDNVILDEDLPVTWTATVETFTEDGLTNLNGAIKDSGNTLFKCTFVQVSGPVLDISNYWATHKIEDVGQLGNDVDKLSTENFQPTNNKLNPVAGEALLKKELIAGEIITTCFIDGALINTAQNLVARIGTKDNVPDVLPDGKLTTADVPKEDTDSILKEQAP